MVILHVFQVKDRIDTVNHTTLRINNTGIQDGGSYECLTDQYNQYFNVMVTDAGCSTNPAVTIPNIYIIQDGQNQTACQVSGKVNVKHKLAEDDVKLIYQC